tara:strand:+ start:140 stop:505 length:366 start_codon:yes stop_codon:yes gene_type:complete
MFKLKDVFKVAVVGAAGYFGGQIGAQFGKQAVGSKIGSALGKSLMSRGSDSEPASAQFARSGVNLRQFGMPTYTSGRAQSEMIPGSLRVVDAMGINSMWENRLNKYLLRRKALSEKTVVKV